MAFCRLKEFFLELEEIFKPKFVVLSVKMLYLYIYKAKPMENMS